MRGGTIEKAIRAERSRQNIVHFQVHFLGLFIAETQGHSTKGGALPAL